MAAASNCAHLERFVVNQMRYQSFARVPPRAKGTMPAANSKVINAAPSLRLPDHQIVVAKLRTDPLKQSLAPGF